MKGPLTHWSTTTTMTGVSQRLEYHNGTTGVPQGQRVSYRALNETMYSFEMNASSMNVVHNNNNKVSGI